MEFIGTWVATAIATIAAVAMVPGITAVGGSYAGPIFAALAIAIVNATIRPIMQALSLPITILTLGIFYLIVNAFALEISSWLAVNVFGAGISIDSFGAAFFGAIIISIVGAIVGSLLGVEQ